MSLVVEDLHVRLGDRPVLGGVDLVAASGEVLAVVGPNGAGKSTLLRAVAGLGRPARGRVLRGGADLLRMDARSRARHVGLVPQTPHLDHPFTVQEVVAMGRYAFQGRYGLGADPESGKVDEALRRTRLTELAHRSVTALSGGERQRVLLARTLAQDPEVYLLDEPTANLDLGQAASVQRLTRELAEAGRTVIVVVHDLAAAARMADRMVLLGGGRVLAEGPAREVVTPAHLATAFGVDVDVTWSSDDVVHLRVHS